MGGYTALAFAARHPDRLAALVLADTRAAADSPEALAGRATALAHDRRAPASPTYLERAWRDCSRPGAPPALVAHLRARAETRADRLLAGIVALRDRPDRTPSWPPSRCPTLVVGGRRIRWRRRRRCGRWPRPSRARASRPSPAPATSPTSKRPRRSSRGGAVPRPARTDETREAGAMKLDATFSSACEAPPRRGRAARRADGRRRRGRARLGAGRRRRSAAPPRAACPTRRSRVSPRPRWPATPGGWCAGTVGGPHGAAAVRPRARLRGLLRRARSASACAWSAALGVRTLIVTNAAGGVNPVVRRRARSSPSPTTST